jgi:hypothetical protein
MSITLTKDHANRVTCINNGSVVYLPANVFAQGEMLMLFNNSDNFITLQSHVEKTYQSGRKLPKPVFEWPPRTLVNVIFIANDLAVVSVEIS